ncbi:hypothetical protein [Caballeronia arationis]|uniref:hypothetical protein n=1 Tax=Caballeronia arationis TaxID=1777142 RepID=UPI001198227D|nr:hypothetical protein [Caballeronia arationis]
MTYSDVTFRGYLLKPLAVFDSGKYAAIVIFEKDGKQRASGVLGRFASSEEAREFALRFGRSEIDDQLLIAPF